MTFSRESLTVVVRTSGERTEDVCRESIERQAVREVHIVRERPFLSALRASIRIGIEAAREWTLCVDADVVLAPGSISRMVRALKENEDAFFVCGVLLDRFYGEPKARGAHLYRTSFLPEAELAIPVSEAVERPETAMKDVLIARGRASVNLDDRVLGLHGYGQYYRDVFRTIAVRGMKSPDQLAPLMDRFCRNAGRDIDLRVALWALIESLDSEFSLDARQWDLHFDRLCETTGLRERTVMGRFEARRLVAIASFASAFPLRAWRALRLMRRSSPAG